MEIFRLFGSIFVDTEAAENSMHKVENAAEKLGQGIVAAGEKVSSIGNKLTMGVTTPIVALGAKAVKTAADFDSAMSEVSAISGATGTDLQKLEELAKKMGETTKFSASESADALKYMAMAGWKTEDMLNGLEGVMNLAAASGEDLGTTSDIVTDALTAFGLSASDSGHFADLLAKASSNANTNVGMMGETFKYVAPVAGALGYKAEDVALAVGLMANSGIKASQAGTSLRSSLTNLANPTKTMQTMMVSLGLATEDTANVIDNGKLQKAQTKVESKTIDMEKAQIKYNDAVAKYGASSSQAQTAALNLEKAENNLAAAISELDAVRQGEIETTGISNRLLVDSKGNMRSFREVIAILRDAFKDLSEEEQAQAAATLFGKEAMSGMLAIINSSEEDFNKLASAIDSADGAAKEMADTMNDNLNGQITLLKSQLEALFIQFAELIMPYLRQGVEWLSKVLTYISNLDEGTKKMIIKIGLLAAAIGPVLSLLGKGISVVGSVITVGSKLFGGIGSIIKIGGLLSGGIAKVIGLAGSIVSAISTLIPAIGSIAVPVLAVIAVIAALVAAGVALYKNWDTIKEYAGKIWNGIKDIVGGAIDHIKGFFSGIIDFIGNNWQSLLTLLVNPFVGGFKLLYENCDGFRNFIDGFLGNLREGFSNFVSGTVEKAGELKDKFVQKANELKDGAVEKFSELGEKVSGKVEELKNATVEKFNQIKEDAADNFKQMGENVSSAVHNIKENVVNGFGELRDRAGERIASLKEGVVSHVEEMKESASRKVTEMSEKISSGFQNLKENAAAKFSDLKEKWTDKFVSAREKMVSESEEIREKVGENLSQLRDGAVDKISSIAEKAVSGFGTLQDKGIEAVGTLKERLSEHFDNMGQAISSKFETIGSKISSMFSGASDIVKGIVDKLKGFMDFDWKLPKIKLPHFDISWDSSGFLGSLASKIGLPGLPKLEVEWYKHGGIMMDPTAFGINPSSGKAMVGGEAGPEAIAPIELLKGYVREAVAERDGQLYDILTSIHDLLREYLPKWSEMQVVLDTGELVGVIARPMNEELGWVGHMRKRRY